MEVKSSCSKVSDGNEEYVISYWMKSELCYKMTKKLNRVLVFCGR